MPDCVRALNHATSDLNLCVGDNTNQISISFSISIAARSSAMAANATHAQDSLKVQVAIESQWVRFFAGGLASGTAEIFTLPIDCTKVRLQAQRSVLGGVVGATAAPAQYTGMIDAASKIVKEEGPTALWKGATPALIRQISYTSICMVLYEPIRDLFGANRAGQKEVPFFNKFMAGGVSGAIGISLANPYVALGSSQ